MTLKIIRAKTTLKPNYANLRKFTQYSYSPSIALPNTRLRAILNLLNLRENKINGRYTFNISYDECAWGSLAPVGGTENRH
jgi:hypothetical protein